MLSGLHQKLLRPLDLADGTPASQVSVLSRFTVRLEGALSAFRWRIQLLGALGIEPKPIFVFELHHTTLPFSQHLEGPPRIIELASPLQL